MSKTSIIFGNGLSRALHNEYFLLDTAMEHVWNSENCCLTSKEKELIQSTLKDKLFPNQEDDLYHIHKIMYIVEFLKKFDSDEEIMMIFYIKAFVNIKF